MEGAMVRAAKRYKPPFIRQINPGDDDKMVTIANNTVLYISKSLTEEVLKALITSKNICNYVRFDVNETLQLIIS